MATTEATNTTVEVPRATRGPAILAVVAVVAGVAAYAAFGPPGRGGRPDLFGTRGTAPPRAIKYVEAYRGTPYAEATLVQVAADGRHALVGGLADCVVVELSRGKEVGCLDVRLSMSDVAATSSDGRYLAVVDPSPRFGSHGPARDPVVFDCVGRAQIAGYAAEALDPLDAAAFAKGALVPVRWRAQTGPELRLWIGDGTDAPTLDVVAEGAPPADAKPRVVRRNGILGDVVRSAPQAEPATGLRSRYVRSSVAFVYDAITSRRLRSVEARPLYEADERSRETVPGRRWAVDAERESVARIVGSRVAVASFDAPNDVVYEIGENVTAVGISEGRWLVGEADGYLRVFDGPREVSADRISLKPVRAFGGTASLRWAATFEPGELSDAPSDIGLSSRMRVTRLHRTDRALVFAGDDAREPTPVGGEIAAALGRVVVPLSDSTVVYARDALGGLVTERLGGLPCGFDGRFLSLSDHDGFAAIYDLADPIPRSPLRVPTRPMPDRLSAAVWSGASLLATAGPRNCDNARRARRRAFRLRATVLRRPRRLSDGASYRTPCPVRARRGSDCRSARGWAWEVSLGAEASRRRLVVARRLRWRPSCRSTVGWSARARTDRRLGADALPDVDVGTDRDAAHAGRQAGFVLVEYRRVADDPRRQSGVRSIRLGTFASGLLPRRRVPPDAGRGRGPRKFLGSSRTWPAPRSRSSATTSSRSRWATASTSSTS
jgi:hypothetical protein